MRPSSRWPKWPFSRDFYSAAVSVLALMGFCFCTMADVSHAIKYAPNPSYDNIPITPKTWEEVDLIYYSTISGHRYTNAIHLLRPIAWVRMRHMDIIGSKVTLSMPEFGIVNVLATVKGIKPTRIDTRGVDWSKQNSAPVIGKFMRYVTDVRTYTFKDSLGHISHINTTPNHPFYVKNKHGFVAIGNVSDDDTLVRDVRSGGNHIDCAMHLVCDKGIHSHCGTAFVGVGLPVSIYNFEVYRRHVYRVGGGGILVHNDCRLKLNSGDHVFHFLMSESGSIPVKENHVIMTSGVTHCAAAGFYDGERVIMTHIWGSNPDFMETRFKNSLIQSLKCELRPK